MLANVTMAILLSYKLEFCASIITLRCGSYVNMLHRVC